MNRLEQLLEFHREDPTEPFTRFALASEYMKRGDLDRARHYFEDLLQSDPTYVGTYYHLGRLYERLRLSEAAVQTYEAGVLMARQLNDFHARSELQQALMQLKGLVEEEDADH